MTDLQLREAALAEGFAAAEVVETGCIPFEPKFRVYCEENLCGKYGANHSCPPDCGTCEQMRQRIVTRRRAVVLQTNWDIPNLSDGAAIRRTKGTHNQASIALMRKLRAAGVQGFMVGASGCALCDPCTAVSGEPCRYPDLQYSCMSAYCIHVSELCARCGLTYDLGPGRVAFFGMYVCD